MRFYFLSDEVDIDNGLRVFHEALLIARELLVNKSNILFNTCSDLGIFVLVGALRTFFMDSNGLRVCFIDLGLQPQVKIHTMHVLTWNQSIFKNSS